MNELLSVFVQQVRQSYRSIGLKVCRMSDNQYSPLSSITEKASTFLLNAAEHCCFWLLKTQTFNGNWQFLSDESLYERWFNALLFMDLLDQRQSSKDSL